MTAAKAIWALSVVSLLSFSFLVFDQAFHPRPLPPAQRRRLQLLLAPPPP